jgi:hypothetical protein
MSSGSDASSSEDRERQQLTILNHLFRAMNTLQHMDGVLEWLATTIVQQLDVQLFQFWTAQPQLRGNAAVQLRAMATQDASLPEWIVVNEQTTRLVESIFNERSTSMMPIEQLFPQYQRLLFKRYGLNYCASFFVDCALVLSNIGIRPPQEQRFTLPAIIATCFLRHPPRYELVRLTKGVTEQAIIMSESRGLLASSLTHPLPPTQAPAPPPPAASPTSAPQTAPQQAAEVPLTSLIPHRKQDPDLMMANNPFASQAAIADKQARRLLTAIDGRKNIGVLCQSTGMNLKEVYTALQVLLNLQRIELYEPEGRLVQPSLFFRDH